MKKIILIVLLIIGIAFGVVTFYLFQTTRPTVCTENWVCTEWSECINDKRTRTCTDKNNCNTTVNKPTETESCASRYAVIEDWDSNQMTVEPLSDEVWFQLVQMYQSGNRRFVGGIVEKYDNKWGFRFKPETVIVTDVTAEGLQATIKYISENLNDWLGGYAYVSSKVVEIHSPS